MKRYLILFFLLFSIVFAQKNIVIKENNLKKADKIINKKLTKKEIKYQKYLKKLQKENEKLEEDGFCSCNNN